MTTRIRAAGIPLAVLAVVAAVHLDALDAPFLWDDLALLEQNCVRRFCSVSQYLTTPFWDLGVRAAGTGLLYRPFTTVSLAIDGVLHGQNAAGFHATNLLFHLINVGLLYVLSRRIGGSRLASGLAALIWGLLPRLVESVTWVSGRTDVLYTWAALSAILVWRSGSPSRRVAAVVFALASAFAKEAGVAALFALVIAELTQRSSWQRRLWALLPVATLSSYLALRAYALRHSAQATAIALTPLQRVWTVAESLGRYAWMTIDPWQPAAQIGVVSEPRFGFVGVGLGVAVVVAALVARHWRRLTSFGWVLLVLGTTPLLLVIHLIGMPWIAVVGDRLGYLPWAVLAAVCARAATIVTNSQPRLRWWGAGAVAVLAATLVPVTRQRIATFSNEVEFWVDTVETTAPTNWGPTIVLSGLYLRGGLAAESLTVAESLKQRCPSPAKVLTHEIVESATKAMSRLGRYEEAFELYRRAFREQAPGVLLTSAKLRLALLDVDGADQFARAARRLNPSYIEAAETLNTIARLRRVTQELQRNPGNDRRLVLGAQRDMLSGRLPDAERQWLGLLENPELPSAVADEGFSFLVRFGSPKGLTEALTRYRRRPDHLPALIDAAEVTGQFTQRLSAMWPRVVAALHYKNASSGRCNDVGLFSD